MAKPDIHDLAVRLAEAGFYVLGEAPMDDDQTRTASADNRRIRLSDDLEIRRWSEKFQVSKERLRAAVTKVGNRVDDVERELRSS